MSVESIGNRFGKPDIERLGIFAEASYMNGKGYKPIYSKPEYLKGGNMLTRGEKLRCGTQDGYFEDNFKRLFIGEGIKRPKKRGEIKPSAPTIPFVLNSVSKKHSTPGDNYGTFTKEQIPSFSPVVNKPKFKHEPGNFIWRTGKIGGPGYADSGIDKYPTHEGDLYGVKQHLKAYGHVLDGPFINSIFPKPFFSKENPYTEHPKPDVGLYLDRFKKSRIKPVENWNPTGPAKWFGGSHAGCFNEFPEFMPCKYVNSVEANKPRGSGKLTGVPFVPIPLIPKTQFTTSIVNHSVDYYMNTENQDRYVPCYIDRLLTDWYA